MASFKALNASSWCPKRACIAAKFKAAYLKSNRNIDKPKQSNIQSYDAGWVQRILAKIQLSLI